MNWIKCSEWIIWILIVAILIGLYFQSMISKNIRNQVIESGFVIVFLVAMILIRDIKTRMQIKIGLFRAYGQRIGFNYIALINIGFGVMWIILGFLSFKDSNVFIFKFTLGICFIIAGLSNRLRYYIKITDKSISKLDLDFMKISAIELITYSPDKIVIKTNKRTIEIYYADLKSDEKQLIINDFEAIRIKNNLA